MKKLSIYKLMTGGLMKGLKSISSFIQKIFNWCKKIFILFCGLLRIFLKKYLEKRECKKVLKKIFNDVLEASYLNPVSNRRGRSRMATTSRESLNDILEQANEKLRGRRWPFFAPGAFPILVKSIKRYVGLLIIESINVSERMRLDDISRTNIEQAVDALGSSKTRKKHRIMATAGGILAGATFSCLISEIHKESPDENILWKLLVLVIIGVFVMAWGLFNE
jgi:hypothetical protein